MTTLHESPGVEGGLAVAYVGATDAPSVDASSEDGIEVEVFDTVDDSIERPGKYGCVVLGPSEDTPEAVRTLTATVPGIAVLAGVADGTTAGAALSAGATSSTRTGCLAAAGMVFVVDADGRFTLITETLADRLGYDRSTIEGRRVDLVLPDGEADQGRTALAENNGSGSFETEAHRSGNHRPGRGRW
jgi:PAS domain-containing protein